MTSPLKLLRKRFRAASWNYPVVRAAFYALDGPDAAVRAACGRGALPRFSTRVRSRGVVGQFGGALFERQGHYLTRLLQHHAGLTRTSDVLEVGCGCGCAAYGLAAVLEDGRYQGLDIDRVSIEACRTSERLRRKGFRFDWLDVANGQYNPDGAVSAAAARFPREDASADVVFLISVITHMLPADVEPYVLEIGRVLRPGGRCLVTTFLMDWGHDGASIVFPHDHGDYRLQHEELPEHAVGYQLAYLDRTFAAAGLQRRAEPLLGGWRRFAYDGATAENTFSQDVLVYHKA